MIRRPPRSTLSSSSAASDVYKRQSVLKAGYVREDGPKSMFSNVVGYPRYRAPIPGFRPKDFYVGDEAIQRAGAVQLERPMCRGRVVNWGDMERVLFDLFFNQLCINPSDESGCILLADTPLNPTVNRRKTVQVMFETFNAAATFIAPQPVLSVYASGRTTGMVLHSGDGATVSMPIHEGYAIPECTHRTDLAGVDLSTKLQQQLVQAGHELNGTGYELELVRRIKEKLCRMPGCPGGSLGQDPGVYVLPDGGRVELDDEMRAIPELMFEEESCKDESERVDSMVARSIYGCDQDVQTALAQTVLLSGGNTLIPGFQERTLWHLKQHGLNSAKVLAPGERMLSVWIGGSILGSLPNFRQMWISADDYHEKGPQIVDEKCF
eukprot:TRINITY_DN37897_c0_g1_i1.p1 TRINITY_DN37897_c0_g1~~TRINITY_DN37897_c0_g1_i1.p1  ORF type:complete len:380 (-),score=74.09 TRINITY_DN37897_c0_g1_i1:161-1300(-)